MKISHHLRRAAIKSQHDECSTMALWILSRSILSSGVPSIFSLDPATIKQGPHGCVGRLASPSAAGTPTNNANINPGCYSFDLSPPAALLADVPPSTRIPTRLDGFVLKTEPRLSLLPCPRLVCGADGSPLYEVNTAVEFDALKQRVLAGVKRYLCSKPGVGEFDFVRWWLVRSQAG